MTFYVQLILLLVAAFGCVRSEGFGAPMEFAPGTKRILFYGPRDSWGGIYRFGLDESADAVKIVPTNLVNTSTGIAIDPVDEKIYWIADTQFGDVDKIRRSNLDGTNLELFTSPAGQPTDIEIDPIGRKAYWPDRFTDAIYSMNLDGSGRRSHSVDDPRGMDLDLANGFMYWVEFELQQVRRARLDGTGTEVVISAGMTRPIDVTVDSENGRLYWVELGSSFGNGKVWGANIDGSMPFLIAIAQQPTDLVIDRVTESIIWADSNTLLRADFDGTNIAPISAPSMTYDNLALLYAPVPEPSSAISIAVAVLFTSIALRRRRRASSPRKVSV